MRNSEKQVLESTIADIKWMLKMKFDKYVY